MNLTRTALALLVLAAVAYAEYPTNYGAFGSIFGKGPLPESGIIAGVGRTVHSLNPANWIPKVIESIPKVEDISFRSLLAMPANAAGALLNAVLQHSRLLPFSGKLYTPQPSDVKISLITPESNVSVPLKNPKGLKSPELKRGEVTVLITGLPSNSEDPSDAITVLVEAYRARYEIDANKPHPHTLWGSSVTGHLLVVELGNDLDTFKKWATLNIQETGRNIGQAIREIFEDKCDHIHIIGTNVAAHVAGTAALYIAQETGQKVRRVTGLDPSKIYTKEQQIQSELKRGVAQFVDVIHTTHKNAGSVRNGDADYYVDNPEYGTENIFEASLNSVRYYAETVIPGNERNFMSVECNSMQDYEEHRCYGTRLPMGYAPAVGTKGNYVLKVNAKSPYGKNGGRQENASLSGSLYY